MKTFSLDGVLFNKSQTLLIAYPGGKASSYAIPSSVTNVLWNPLVATSDANFGVRANRFGFSIHGNQ